MTAEKKPGWRNYIYPPLLVTGLAMAGLALHQEEEPPLICTEQALPPAPTFAADLKFYDIIHDIKHMPLLAENDELGLENEANYAHFLTTKGIEIEEGVPNKNSWVFYLATLPKQLIETAGLEKVVISPERTLDIVHTPGFTEPRHDKHTLYIKNQTELEIGLSAMILDASCDMDQLEERFKTITKAAGYAYSQTEAAPERGSVHYEETFWDKKSIFETPRAEILNMFSQHITGMAFEPYNPTTPLGEKHTLIRQVFDAVLPGGESYQQLFNFGLGVGTHGLYSEELLNRVHCMFQQLTNARTDAEYNHIIMVDAGEEAPDPTVRDCDHWR